MVKLSSVKQLQTKDLKGRTVLLRVDFNVPIKKGKVTNGYRVLQSLPTIKYLSDKGARVVLISHLGDSQASLKPVAQYLNQYIQAGFAKFSDKLGDRISGMPEGGILLVENLRQLPGEEQNSSGLAKQLASWGDLYVNNAFSASHRRHVSIVGLPKLLPAYAGLLFVEEYDHLSQILNPQKPFVLILGGAKFETKIPLVKKYITKADQVFIGGALAHVFFRKMGYEIGKSLVDKDMAGLDKFLKSPKVHLPVDVVVKTTKGDKVKKPEELNMSDVIYDAGPETVAQIKQALAGAKTVLWNGPLGNFEKGYDQGTKEIAKLVAKAEAYSVVGGGDTVAAIAELNLSNKLGFVSTAGGAMLDFLSDGTLPGIEVLLNKK